MMIKLIYVFFHCLWITTINADQLCLDPDSIHKGSCQIFQGAPDLCKETLTNSSIWVPEGKTQIGMFIDKVSFFGPFLDFADEVGKDPDLWISYSKCFGSLGFWGCSWIFPTCKRDEETGLDYPQPMCLDVCELLYSVCQNLFDVRPDLKSKIECGDCSTKDLIVHLNITNAQNDTELFDLPIQCDSHIPPDHACIYPLSSEGRIVYNKCGMVCPYPTWSEEEWDTIKALTLGLSIISCVATLALISNLISTPQKRKFPNNLPTYLTCSSFGLSLSYLLESMVGFENVWCEGGRICEFQGWMVMFFMLSVSSWWFSVCFNIFLSTIMEVQQKPNYEIYYHIFSWGFPLFLSLLYVGLDFIVYNFGENTCDIIAPVSTETPWERIWGYYIPIGSQLILGTFMILSVFYKILQISSDWKTFKKLLAAQMRILLFLFVFMLIQAFFFSYHLDRTLKTEDVFSSVRRNSICESLVTDGEENDCNSVQTFNFGLFVLSIISSSGQGIFFAGLFGASVSSFKQLKSKFRTSNSARSTEKSPTLNSISPT